jgi:tight adherence protein C
MDQIMINVEAGQSFDAAVTRVSNRGTGPAAEEFRRVMQDIQFGMTRREALEHLLERTDVPELRETVQALSQAERYGVPLGQVLRVQADELRDKRKQRAEERAMKVPVKILFPLMICILPALMVVIVGPGIISLVQRGGIAG